MKNNNLVGSLRNVFYRSTDGKNANSIQSNENGIYIRHRNWLGFGTQIKNDLDARDSTFIIRPNPQGTGV